MEQIERIFKRRGFRMSENNRRQAYIPEGSLPIENPKGTAPGFIVEGPQWVTLALPGVPSEMEYLMGHAVIPYLRKRFDLKKQVIRYKTLRACGLGESGIGLQIQDLMKKSRNPTVGALASIGDIRIRITADADDPEEADRLISEMEREIRNRLGVLIYGVNNETLQGNIVHLLEKFNLTLSVVETFTAGVVSQKLEEPGSASFVQGLILPAEISQRKYLNLSADEFNSIKGDPKRLADSFAQKSCSTIGTDLGLATFGIILEDRTGDDYRMKTFYSLSTSLGIEHQELPLGGEPPMVRERSSIIALDLLRKFLLKLNSKT